IHIGDVTGDFEERASRVSDAIRNSGIAVAFFHGGLEQQITARVASMRAAPVQIAICYDSHLDADLFDARIQLSEHSIDRTRFSGPAVSIPPASDIEARLHRSESVTRQSMGIEAATSVSATFGDLHYAAGREFLGVLVEIMNRFPKHFHLF